ncbi:hypothetical protein EVA_04392 [gut metagenome]|uniref:Uncharacterized protein n=1 Tax=gut metagenome TaxID=749906 RepID=J9GJR0_9ZZZZ
MLPQLPTIKFWLLVRTLDHVGKVVTFLWFSTSNSIRVTLRTEVIALIL